MYTNISDVSSHSDLKAQGLAGLRRNSSLDVGAAQKGVSVRGRARGQRPLRRRVRTLTTKDGVNDHSIPIQKSVSTYHFPESKKSQGGFHHSPVFVTALREHHLLPAVLEHGALHQGLRPHARVDARALLVVVVVEDVGRAEAQEGAPGVDLVEVVVGVGDAEVAGVLGGVGVGVAY